MRGSLFPYQSAHNVIFTQFSQGSTLEKMIKEIQEHLKRTIIITEKQLRYWKKALSNISDEKIKSSDYKLMLPYSQVVLSLKESMRLLESCKNNPTRTLSISVESYQLEKKVDWNLDQYEDLWNVVLSYLCLQERAGTATISKKWRNLVESYPLEGIIPMMWSGNDVVVKDLQNPNIGWIFLNAGMYQYSLGEWRQRLYELSSEEIKNLQHMQVMSASASLAKQIVFDIADFDAHLGRQSNVLNEFKKLEDEYKINEKHLRKNIILCFLIAIILGILILRISDNPFLIVGLSCFTAFTVLLLSGSCFFKSSKIAIRIDELSSNGKEIHERQAQEAACFLERAKILTNTNKLLEIKPAQDLKDRLDSFTTIHEIPNPLVEVKKSPLASQHFIVRSSKQKYPENQQDELASIIARWKKLKLD